MRSRLRNTITMLENSENTSFPIIKSIGCNNGENSSNDTAVDGRVLCIQNNQDGLGHSMNGPTSCRGLLRSFYRTVQ